MTHDHSDSDCCRKQMRDQSVVRKHCINAEDDSIVQHCFLANASQKLNHILTTFPRPPPLSTPFSEQSRTERTKIPVGREDVSSLYEYLRQLRTKGRSPSSTPHNPSPCREGQADRCISHCHGDSALPLHLRISRCRKSE